MVYFVKDFIGINTFERYKLYPVPSFNILNKISNFFTEGDSIHLTKNILPVDTVHNSQNSFNTLKQFEFTLPHMSIFRKSDEPNHLNNNTKIAQTNNNIWSGINLALDLVRDNMNKIENTNNNFKIKQYKKRIDTCSNLFLNIIFIYMFMSM